MGDKSRSIQDWERLLEEILSIDFILNIERIAEAVQPETDKLLSGL